MSNSQTGIVTEVKNIGMAKGSGLVLDNGMRYGVYDPASTGLDKVAVGDTVSFNYKSSGKWNNIQGAITVTSSGGGAPAWAAPVTKAAPKAAGGRSFGTFPIPPLDGQRSIIRQNSITNAVNTVSAMVANDKAAMKGIDLISTIIETAKRFEEYSSGDLDAKEAKEAIEKLEE